MNIVKYYDPAVLTMRKAKKSGWNSDSTLLENRRLIIHLIQRAGIISRHEIAEKTNLRHATVTIIINEFLKKGIIEEAGLQKGENHRRVMGFRIANAYCAIAVRINVSYVLVSVYDIHMNALRTKKVFMDTLNDLVRTCEVICGEIEAARQYMGERKVLGIAVSAQGPIKIHHDRYQYLNTETGVYFDIGKELHQKTGHLVVVNRMTNYNAYHCWNIDKEREYGILLTINISYTIECGMMVNGEMLNGHRGLSGMLGNVLFESLAEGKARTLDELAAVPALLGRVRQLLDAYPQSSLHEKKENLNIRDVIDAHSAGDALARLVYDECAIYCGRAVAMLVNLLNPSVIYLGDEIPYTEEFYQKVQDEALRILGRLNATWCLSDDAQSADHSVKGQPVGKINLVHNKTPRNAKFDPSLLGAAEYLIDLVIGEREFLELDA